MVAVAAHSLFNSESAPHKHRPSSTGEQRGCRSQGAGPGSRAADLTLMWYSSLLLPSMHVLVPRLVNPTLTDVQNFSYHCLPYHRLRWLRVPDAPRPSKDIKG